MQVVSVINYKGGVGKTTLTANLGAELAYRNYNVLLLDMDPQASLTFSFVKPEEWANQYKDAKTIKRWYDAVSQGESLLLTELIIHPSSINSRLPSGRGRLDLICSHLGLLNVDLELASELGGGTLNQTKRNFFRVHRRLSLGIAEIDSSSYDLILIDCPPNFNIVTRNAIAASQFLLIPAKPDYLSTLGIDYLRGSLREFVANYNEFANLDDGKQESPINPEILGVIFTMVQFYGGQPISAVRPYIEQTKRLGEPVFNSYIRENKTIFSEAPAYGIPVVLTRYASGSHTAAVDGLEECVTEFEEALGLTRRD